MDMDYTCGHKFCTYRGAKTPIDCPRCGEGSLIGVQDQFYMSDELRQRLHDALASIKPLTDERRREEREEVIRLAKAATDHLAGCKVEIPLGHLYDIGMLRKVGDQ